MRQNVFITALFCIDIRGCRRRRCRAGHGGLDWAGVPRHT